MVCLPGPPMSSTGKTPECKKTSWTMLHRTKNKHVISCTNRHVYLLLQQAIAMWQSRSCNCEMCLWNRDWGEEKTLNFNRLHSGKHGLQWYGPSLVLCCWSAQYKFENWSWTLSMAKLNEAIVSTWKTRCLVHVNRAVAKQRTGCLMPILRNLLLIIQDSA